MTVLNIEGEVPFFDYPGEVYEPWADELHEILSEIGGTGAFILQNHLKQFERDVARYQGAGFAVGVGNATDGLELALRCVDIGPGDEVVVSTHTFVATAAAVQRTGATPICVDIREDGLIDPGAVERAIGPNTRCIMPTQLNGAMCDMHALSRIADGAGIPLIEDAAQSLGADYSGKRCGTFGTAAVISFYPAKLLGCLGDGGVVLTNDESIAAHLALLRDHGRDPSGVVVAWGYNSRLDNLQAAFLNIKFQSYEASLSRRSQHVERYESVLSQVREVDVPRPLSRPEPWRSVHQNFEVLVERRTELARHLRAAGIATGVQWGGAGLHTMTQLGLKADCPVADEYFSKSLMLPLYVGLTVDQVDAVCRTIADFYGAG